MTTHETLPPTLPPEGRRVAFVGKGGTAKSTIIAYLLAHWNDMGIEAAAMDADEPGDEENGSLMDWADMVNLPGPVYPAPSRAQILDRARKLTPAHGILAIDTGAWIRKAGNTHFAVLAATDLVVLTMSPTPMELNRAGSVLAALDHLNDVGAHVPRLAICMTRYNSSAAAVKEITDKLLSADYHVLKSGIPNSDARDGYSNAFGRIPRVVAGSPMDNLARELAAEVDQ
jgi:MinD superfamily P-loop ATPase